MTGLGDVHVHEAGWELERGGGGESLQTELIKGFWENLQHLTFRCMGGTNYLFISEQMKKDANKVWRDL